MNNLSQIKPNMPIVCSKNMQFAISDHLEDEVTIKVNKDDKGRHHYIPLSWVTLVDDKIHSIAVQRRP